MGGATSALPWGGSGAGVQWESEEGVLDLGLLVVLFDELGRGDSSEGPPLAWGVAPLCVCLEARGSLYWGPVATGELGWEMPWR